MSAPRTSLPISRVRPGILERIGRVWVDEYDTAVNWPKGRRHLVTRAIAITVVDTVALVAAAWLLPQVRIQDVVAALSVTVVAGVLTFLVRPVAFLVVPQSIVVTGVLTVVFMGLMLEEADALVPGVVIDGLPWSFVTAFIIALINALLVGILGLDEDESFYRNSLKKLARVSGDVDDRPGPGFVIIQIDGVAEPVIKSALRTGYMPFLAGWLRDGSHRLGRWEALAPSMTAASQAGILHGNNAGIPAFRWWEKDRDHLMVANHPDDAWLIEQRASGTGDLLRDGGASIANLVSGGAPRSIATNSQLSSHGAGLRMESFALYLVNPYNVTRGALSFVYQLIVEYFQARRQRTRDVRPRISRGMPFPFLRAWTTTILRDMVTDLVIGEMYRGTPVVYADFLGYDEVAHHAGPERPEAMDELDRVDRMLRTFERAAVGAPRTYHFILCSDHGQSQGATFEDRYGQGLEALVRSLMRDGITSLDATGDVEGWGPVTAFLAELARTPGSTARVAGRALRRAEPKGVAKPRPRARGGRRLVRRGAPAEPPTPAVAVAPAVPPAPPERPDLVVAASGNLANIYFPGVDHRMSLEEIETEHPGLMAGLVAHPGIGFALVHSEQHGALAIGRKGIHYLGDDRIVGEDPLIAFGEHAPGNLRRLDTFQNVGDILVNSMYDPSTEEIASFEHQVGAHGGLGGPQTKAFVVYPSALEGVEEPVALVGAEALNAKLREWMATARRLEGAAAPVAAPERLRPEVAAVLGGAGTRPSTPGG